MDDELADRLIERCQQLGMTRSAYVQQLVRRDLGLGSSMTINDAPASTPTPVPLRPVRYTGKKKRAV